MEYLPLGGFAIKDEIYNKYRKSKRNELGFGDDDVVIVHSGKLDEKKHTDWLIDAVNSVNNNRIKLVIIGSIPSSNAKLHDLIKNNKNSNILYLGWKNSSELIEYICAGDIYAQPGTQSITFNNSICCQTPIIAYDLYSYFYDVSSIIWIKSIDDLKNCLFTIVNDESILANLKTEAISNKNLIDYNKVLFKLMDLKR